MGGAGRARADPCAGKSGDAAVGTCGSDGALPGEEAVTSAPGSKQGVWRWPKKQAAPLPGRRRDFLCGRERCTERGWRNRVVRWPMVGM